MAGTVRMSRWAGLLAVFVGIALGVSLFTFRYAKGLSYFSTDPTACANCHIMQRQFDSWQSASHHTVAKCVDCHLPHGFIPKYLAKAENGYRHAEKFTAQDFEEPITIKKRGQDILQRNCVSCHEGLVHDIAGGPRGALDELRCTHCHAGVGHGERAGLGGPLHHEPPGPSPAARRD